MHLTTFRFWLPKHGSTAREYEDAIARGPRHGPLIRFAVADGASESSFARLWARLLVSAYVRGGLRPRSLIEDLVPLQGCWQARVGTLPRPWYVQAKVQAGAFAALAGLTLHKDGYWCALAAGDCCLFQVRDGALRKAFPLASAEAFDNRPLLISSNAARNGCLATTVRVTDGRWRRHDTFVLASDALAVYLLRAVEEGQAPLDALTFERARAGFVGWVTELRAGGSLCNDDVSLVMVQVT